MIRKVLENLHVTWPGQADEAQLPVGFSLVPAINGADSGSLAVSDTVLAALAALAA